jgi:hypothetical protein
MRIRNPDLKYSNKKICRLKITIVEEPFVLLIFVRNIPYRLYKHGANVLQNQITVRGVILQAYKPKNAHNTFCIHQSVESPGGVQILLSLYSIS